MNIRKYLKISLGVAILGATQISCIHDDNWDAPEIVCTNKFDAPTVSMADVVAMAPATTANTGTTYRIPEESATQPAIIFDAYVVSSDENGNFYKTISFQDSPVNPTVGLSVGLNKSMNYADFPVGAHIRIKANGLVIGKSFGTIQLGSVDPNYAIGRIPQAIIGRYISGVCNGNSLEIVDIVPTELDKIQDIKDSHINTLVKVKNVQFTSSLVGKPLMDKDASGAYVDTDRQIVDDFGGSTVIRTDGFFRTTSYLIPDKSGDVTFVVSKYNANIQNIIRGVGDIDLTKPRFATGIVGGTNITYSGSFTENFESYAVDNALFPSYLNYAYIGNRYWQIKTFSNNKYIQMSANAGGSNTFHNYFMVPVDFTAANSFSFFVNVGFYNGDAFKVYTTTDYTPKADISTATLTDITSSFNIPKTPTSGYGVLASAGTYNFPAALTGNGFIVFKYEGAGNGVTTTIQIDNIVVQ